MLLTSGWALSVAEKYVCVHLNLNPAVLRHPCLGWLVYL